MINTGGVWDPAEGGVYFFADTNTRYLIEAARLHNHVLLAVDTTGLQANRNRFEKMTAEGCSIFIDSGVYSIVADLVEATGCGWGEGFATRPRDMPGFGTLRTNYEAIVQSFPKAWGYVELDLGSISDREEIRAEQNAKGMFPIPVWHPYSDPVAYLPLLLSTHDRIGIGGIANSSPSERRQILAHVSEVKRDYPEAWVHALGVRPNPVALAWPFSSCDSSSWNVSRYHGYVDHAMTRTAFEMPRDYQYLLGDRASHKKVRDMSTTGAQAMQRGWRHWNQRLKAIQEGTIK